MQYPGLDGFLGTRASLMLDVVFLAMFAVVPVMGWSIYLVKYRRRFLLHKRIQLALALVLLATVVLFEGDMRINGWIERAKASPYFETWVQRSLSVHLVFAVSTALLWIFVTVRALRRFPCPPTPNDHSRSHIFWGKLAAIDMLCTAITGWAFYWLAFVS
jgi:putative membrane protein